MKLWRARPAAQNTLARKTLTGPDRKRVVEESIPVSVEIAGQWAWRLLAIVAVVVVVGLLIISLKEIVVPFIIALLISGLLQPFKNFLIRHHWPKWLAVLVAMLLAFVIIAGLIFVIVIQVRSGLPSLEKQSVKAYDGFKTFLAGAPFNISSSQFNDYIGEATTAIGKDTAALATGAKTVGLGSIHALADFALIIFTTLFIVLDGGRIWGWIVRLFPRRARAAVDGSGKAGWVTLTAFVRVQIVVAAVDAVGIGIAALILHLPLAIPIAIVVFLGAFVPVVGAVVTGALAVFVALVYEGPIPAIVMLAVLLVVHLGESHGLQPFLMGNAVKVHPVAVVLAVATGVAVAGIPGALFAVPMVAVLNVMIKYLASGDWRSRPDPGLGDVVEVANESKA
jgi:predicted PurR-regulated permease PerM